MVRRRMRLRCRPVDVRAHGSLGLGPPVSEIMVANVEQVVCRLGC